MNQHSDKWLASTSHDTFPKDIDNNFNYTKWQLLLLGYSWTQHAFLTWTSCTHEWSGICVAKDITHRSSQTDMLEQNTENSTQRVTCTYNRANWLNQYFNYIQLNCKIEYMPNADCHLVVDMIWHCNNPVKLKSHWKRPFAKPNRVVKPTHSN